MKLKLILSIILLFCTTLLTAQLLSEKTNPVADSKNENSFNLILGGSLFLSFVNLDGPPSMGGGTLSSGLEYSTANYNYSIIVEYMYGLKEEWFGGDRIDKINIIHPYFKCGYKFKKKYEIFISSGVGFGNFEVSDTIYDANRERDILLTKNKTLFSLGFGIHLDCIKLSYRTFYPSVVELGSITYWDYWDEYTEFYETGGLKHQITLGLVFDINLSK